MEANKRTSEDTKKGLCVCETKRKARNGSKDELDRWKEWEQE